MILSILLFFNGMRLLSIEQLVAAVFFFTRCVHRRLVLLMNTGHMTLFDTPVLGGKATQKVAKATTCTYQLTTDATNSPLLRTRFFYEDGDDPTSGSPSQIL